MTPSGENAETRQHIFRDGSISTIELGSGPDLLVLHGLLGNPGVSPLLGRLAERYRVVAPSLPGFMPSPCRADIRTLHDWVFTLSELIDSLGMTGAPAVAFSVGGMLALELAAIRPEVFSSLALVAPLGLWVDDDPVADLFAVTTAEQPGLLLRHPEKANAFFVDDINAPDALVEHGLSRYRTMRSLANLTWPIPERGLIDRLRRVACPTAILWGGEDRLISPRYAERFAAALPGHPDVTLIADAGHCAEWDAPDAVASAIELFFARLADDRSEKAA
jgi:pimeloyl-ACP methyl ester carboxylesterase